MCAFGVEMGLENSYDKKGMMLKVLLATLFPSYVFLHIWQERRKLSKAFHIVQG